MTAIPHSTQGPVRSGPALTFSVVGIAAFAAHFCAVVLLVPFGIAPLAANAAGFLTALVVGLAGHYRWTLRPRTRRRGAALRRFAWLAVAGFVLNEINYAALLTDTAIDYRVALLLVLAAVAALTSVVERALPFAET